MTSLIRAVALALLVGANGLSGQAPAHAASERMLQPGDSVRILVWRQVELSGGFIVSTDGALEHPIYKSVIVAGVPLDSARARIASVLVQYMQNPQFVMEAFFRVLVAGEVRLPGVYAVREYATLIQAVTAAGGPTDLARLDRVFLVRRGITTTVDLTKLGGAVGNTSMLSGDQLFVSRRNDILRQWVGPIAGVVGALAALYGVTHR